jgi:hypothetical protein
MPSALALVVQVSKLPGGPKNHPGRRTAGRLTDAAHYGVTLLLATDSKAHIAGLPEIAAKRNATLEERGLFRASKIVAAASEEKISRRSGCSAARTSRRPGGPRAFWQIAQTCHPRAY